MQQINPVIPQVILHTLTTPTIPPTDVDLQPLPAVTFRTIGGVLDFYVFTGPSGDDVTAQYTAVIGRPHVPPYWALGYHLCRWGYGGSAGMKEVIDRNRALGIPYVSVW